MLRISDIKLGTDDTESDLRKKVLKLLGVKNVKSFEISKKSIDARKFSAVWSSTAWASMSQSVPM